ncbi:hypothetical protein [Blastococcus sp. VKM Ac-2987]|uniref:hypothetical protein n=1 Tax=Blastococcus sp. VKM Ac-2987 TaxID=3004141 RepID=UPI0022ABB3C4|nr:hypothetical protein [Blastococcus sp. VKM Ac-2987]MCZ2857425.1 hypothetical protein [Blastococcus sp. VKM Ac-2987]
MTTTKTKTAGTKPPKKTTGGRVTPKKVKVDPTKELVIDTRELNRREMAEIERLAGKPVKELTFDDGTPTQELDTIITYIRLREHHPDITLDEVWDLPITKEIKVRGAEVPTKAASSPS